MAVRSRLALVSFRPPGPAIHVWGVRAGTCDLRVFTGPNATVGTSDPQF